MKIVYYLPSLEAPGGLEHIITYKANYFASCGHQVTILTSEQGDRAVHFPLSPNVKHIDLGVPFDYPYNQSKLSRIIKYPFRYNLFKKRFEKVLLELRADITISTLRREINFLPYLKDGSIKIGEFHITRHAYGFGSTESGSAIFRLIKQKWEKKFVKNLQQLSKIVLLTHEEYDFWPELNNKTVIPNPIVTALDKKSNCSSHKVMAAGRYAPQKGFDLLIKSWAIVAKRYPNWALHIYGDGYLRNELQKQIEDLNIENNCFLEHTVSNIADKYSESSIFVLSSRYEGFGMVITEAMSCGLPVVSFACPCGPKDIITDGRSGFLVKEGDINEMADKISKLIENDNERKQMGEYAYQDSDFYKMQNIATKWIDLFNSLIDKK